MRRVLLTIGIALFAGLAVTNTASAETRSLKLYYIHTKEKKTITFKRNGKYLSKGLKDINRFLRDWRRNEPTKMDPQLLDLVWEAYKMSGSRNHIHVVSAYRSPATNAMLRKTRGGQAKKSQHTLGKAMDFYIPGVKVSKLREIGFKLGGGGVGYYPRSGVPFVHLDTGNVRSWPRMSRSQLKRLFPRGNTAHLPTDGKPLPGYKQALAKYQARKRGKSSTVRGGGSKSNGNLLAKIFGGGRDQEEDNAETVVASARKAKPAAKPKAVATPGTLLAALPSRSLPVPTTSPRARSVVNSVPVAITEQVKPAEPVPVKPVIETAPVEVASAPQEPTYQIPVPQRRPAVLIARAAPPIDRQSAQELEQAIQASNQQAGQVIETATAPAKNLENEANAIIAALNENSEEPAPAATELAYALPIPKSAPARPSSTVAAQLPTPKPLEREASLPETVVAYAPPERSLPNPLSVLPTKRPQQPVAVPKGKSGRSAANTDNTQTAALNTTTPKTARPTQADRIALKPAARPAAEIDPARFGNWKTTNASVAENGRASERPDFIQNATRSAPDVVYTAGFSKTPPPSANTFSGNAVTFLAVAKFESGDGGDSRGEPLLLSVPN